MKKMLAVIALAAMPCASWAAGDVLYGEAGTPPPFDRPMPPPPPSLERTAMDNLLADALGRRSGRTPAEIAALLKDAPPPEVAEQLGISESDMREMFKAAHTQLVERAQAAGLITAEQAQKLRDMPAFGRRVFVRHN